MNSSDAKRIEVIDIEAEEQASFINERLAEGWGIIHARTEHLVKHEKSLTDRGSKHFRQDSIVTRFVLGRKEATT